MANLSIWTELSRGRSPPYTRPTSTWNGCPEYTLAGLVAVTMKSDLVSFFRPFRMRMGPMGERQSVGGAMILTDLKAEMIRSPCSPERSAGRMSTSMWALAHTSLATLEETRENSFCMKLTILCSTVARPIFKIVPSMMPRGWGRISWAGLGSLSVALWKVMTRPSGSRNTMRVCGLTIAVLRRYS